MRSLSLIVLLLFAVVSFPPHSPLPTLSQDIRADSESLCITVVCTAVTPAEWEELLANGAPQRLRSFNNLYLTDERPLFKSLNYWTRPRQDWLQDWTIVQISNREVAIKSHFGHYIGRGSPDVMSRLNPIRSFFYSQEKREDEWDLFTPEKHADGSWSFKNGRNPIDGGDKWLSAHAEYDSQRYYVSLEPANKRCEHWWLEPYTPPATPKHMEELLTNGGRRRFISFNWLYLTDDYPDTYVWTLPQRIPSTPQEWSIVQINNNEVAIKSNRGYYIGHGSGGWAKQAKVADEWEMLTPVKNGDGTWSFHSRWNKWLSGHTLYDDQKYYVNFEENNWRCERWRLEMY